LKNGKLNIGRIPYANLFPIFHYLDSECDKSDITFVKDVPSRLNKMMREGELDISPSSSIEYLRNKHEYVLLPWFSISSSGPIKSILLFSKVPIEELGGTSVALSSESETSTVLLRIILHEFLSLTCSFTSTEERSVRNILSSFSAVLHIGDTAMTEAKALRSNGNKKSAPYIYDLGELWDTYTGLPFVYALWLVRKKALSEKKGLIQKLSSELRLAKKYASTRFPTIARDAPHKKWFTEEELISYWNTISYDFTQKHMEGLQLFEKYALNHKP
jgi:chorismate dehydratase